MARTKVFVGNLSFRTREPGLASAFESAGKVVNAQIVTRGNGRSLGYGFVEFDNEEAANKAIKELNKYSLDEREINVELAKPRPEGGQQPRTGGGRGRGGYNRGYNRYPPSGRAYGYNRGYNRGPRGGYGRGPRGGGRRNLPPKKPIEERNLQPSPTSLFVTNLPFKFTEVEFGNVFIEAGIKPKSVKVATRFNGRSRGYGFVDFETNADQQKALSAVDKKTVEGRELVAKIAMFDPQAQGQGQPAPQATPQPAPGQTAQPAKPAVPAPATNSPQQKPVTSPQPTQPTAKPAQPAQPAVQNPNVAKQNSPQTQAKATPPNTKK